VGEAEEAKASRYELGLRVPRKEWHVNPLNLSLRVLGIRLVHGLGLGLGLRLDGVER